MKRKVVTGESSQQKTSKRNEANSKNMNSPSLARSSVQKVETTAPSEKLQKGNLGSAKTEEARNRKRKAEETQKKTKPNGTKSANPKSNSRKEKKMEPNSPNPDTILSRKPSVATTPQKLVKDILSLQKSERWKDEHKEENIFQKNVKKFQSSTSRQQEKMETNNPFSEKTKPLKSKSQNQNGRQKTHRPSSSSRNRLSAKTSGTQKEVVAPKNQKAVQSKTETSSVDKSKEPITRRLKVMQILGLVAPAGSQFHRSRGASSRKK